MKKVVLVILLVLSLFACSSNTTNNEFKDITKDSYEELVDKGYYDMSVEYSGRIKEIDNAIVSIKNGEDTEPVYTFDSDDDCNVLSVRKIEKDEDSGYIKITTYNIEDKTLTTGIYDSDYSIIHDGLGYTLWLTELDPEKNYKKENHSELIYTCAQDLIEAKEIDDSTIGGLNIFDYIESITVVLNGDSNLNECLLVFDNTYTQNKFVENIEAISEASKYSSEESEDGSTPKKLETNKESSSALEFFNLYPVVSINYENNSTITLTIGINGEDGMITISGTNYYGQDIDGVYVGDEYVISKTIADLIRYEIPYIGFSDAEGNLSSVKFLKPLYYKGDGFHIESNIDDIYENKNEEEVLYPYDVGIVKLNEYEIYEDDTRLKSLPLDGAHKIELREANSHNKYGLVYDTYSQNVELDGTYKFYN